MKSCPSGKLASQAPYKGNLTEHCFNNKQMPFLTLVATTTGKSSRALEEQIVLSNIYNKLYIEEKELIRSFSLQFTCSFIISSLYTENKLIWPFMLFF
jgi:hypothetical protein